MTESRNWVRRTLNGSAKPVSIGTITGLLVAMVAFVSLHLTLSDRFRKDGYVNASIESRVAGVEGRVGKLEHLHDQNDKDLLRFFGELPGLRNEINRLNNNLTQTQQEVGKLRDELSAIKGRNSAMDKMGNKGMVRIGDPQ